MVRIGRVGPEQHLQVAGSLAHRDRDVKAVRLARVHRRLRHAQGELQRNVPFGENLAITRQGNRSDEYRRGDNGFQLHGSTSFAPLSERDHSRTRALDTACLRASTWRLMTGTNTPKRAQGILPDYDHRHTTTRGE